MSAAFTPAPWAAAMDRGNYRRSCVTADGVMIAQAFDRVEADAEANAHLIAAAPELYEALHQMLLSFGSDIRAYDADLYHAAYDALAKARGEQVTA